MRLEIKQKQNIAITMAMQQAFLVLQMPSYELAAWLQIQIDQNPVLEYQEVKGEPLPQTLVPEIDFEKQKFEVLDDLDDLFRNSLFSDESLKERKKEAVLSFLPSLFEHLMNQAKEVFLSQKELSEAEKIIGNLNSRGFLEDLDVDSNVLKMVQTFDPPGIAARNLQESLLIQLRLKKKADSMTYHIIERYFDDLLHNRLPELGKRIKISIEKLHSILQAEISSLDFSPGHRFFYSTSPPLIPDIYVEKNETSWQISLNDSFLPRFQITPPHFDSLKSEEWPYIRSHIAQGKWLLRILRKRGETLKKITLYLLQKQADFFNGQLDKLKPLTLHQAALELNLNESTVARAVSDKYLSSPQGIFSLKSFFTPALFTSTGKKISTKTAKDLISSLIQSEDKYAPLSDETLSLALKKRGIGCARRTVTKYRKLLQIPTASQRKVWSRDRSCI